MRYPRSLEVLVLTALCALIVPWTLTREESALPNAQAAPMRPPDSNLVCIDPA